MGQKQVGIATRRDLCVGRLTLGKHHTRTHVRTCAHGYMPRAYVHAANHGTATRDGIAATSRDLCVGRLWWENIICVLICVHAHMCTCVYAYVRTHTRTYVCAHVLHIWVRVFFFSSVSLSTHRSTSRDTVASRMSRGTAVYRLLLIHRLLLILFVRMSVRLTCAVTHVRTYEYAYWAFPAWTFPRIGLYESPPLYFEKWFKAFITATDSLSMAARKSSLAPLLTPRVTALLQSK